MASVQQHFDVPVMHAISLASVEAGVETELLDSFVATSGLSLAETCEVVIPLRTLKHRRARGETLSLDESDKFGRLVRLYSQTVAVFANRDKALWWLRGTSSRLGDRTPLAAIRTEAGGRLVEEMLGQLDEGMFI